jgi:predicted aspartyl protease
MASFVGMVPASNPRLVVLVVVDRPRGAVEVPIDARGSSVIVPVTFNGSVTANLALDTGASRTMISRRIANNLALYSFTSGRFAGIGGSVTASIARIQSVKIGEAEVADLVVGIHDFSSDPRVEGLLGFDFLRHFHVTLDARKQLLTLSPR